MSTTPPPALEPGRSAAIIVYALYLLSIPSAAIFALFGVIVALAGRDGSGPLARSHLEYQARIWFTAFWWTIGLAILGVVGWITFIIGGFLLVWLAGLGALVLYLWFTVVSLFGLLALLDNRPK
ncbi:MAG: hypothetical protein R3C30_07030 [Hyphomonadaceae bacterium]